MSTPIERAAKALYNSPQPPSHDTEALNLIDEAKETSIKQLTNALLATAQVHATLALADATRTANLLTAFNLEVYEPVNVPHPAAALHNQILARLGMTETDTP